MGRYTAKQSLVITDKLNNIEKLLIKFGSAILWINLIASLVLNVIYITDGNPTYTFSLYFFLPLFFIYSCYLYLYKLPNLKAKNGNLKSIAILISVVLMATFFFGSYLIGLNATIGEQKKIEVSGKIINLETQEGRKGSVNHYVTFIDYLTNRERILKITLNEREQYQNGDEYKKVWLSGILGVKYLKVWGKGAGTIKSNKG